MTENHHPRRSVIAGAAGMVLAAGGALMRAADAVQQLAREDRPRTGKDATHAIVAHNEWMKQGVARTKADPVIRQRARDRMKGRAIDKRRNADLLFADAVWGAHLTKIADKLDIRARA